MGHHYASETAESPILLSSIYIPVQRRGKSISQDVQVAKKRVLWWDDKQPDQRTLFANYIVVDEEFFRELIEHNFPVDLRALKLLQASCLGLDYSDQFSYPNGHVTVRKQHGQWKVFEERPDSGDVNPFGVSRPASCNAIAAIGEAQSEP